MIRSRHRHALTTAEAVRLKLGWKHALGLEVGYEGFRPTSLVVFRGRSLELASGRMVFDAILQALEAAGLVRNRLFRPLCLGG